MVGPKTNSYSKRKSIKCQDELFRLYIYIYRYILDMYCTVPYVYCYYVYSVVYLNILMLILMIVHNLTCFLLYLNACIQFLLDVCMCMCLCYCIVLFCVCVLLNLVWCALLPSFHFSILFKAKCFC